MAVTPDAIFVGGDLVRVVAARRGASYLGQVGIVQGKVSPQFATLSVLVKRPDGSYTAPMVSRESIVHIDRATFDAEVNSPRPRRGSRRR